MMHRTLIAMGLLAAGVLFTSAQQAGASAAREGVALPALTLSVELDVQPRGESPKRPVTPGETLLSGDRIWARIEVSHPSYVYVVLVHASGDHLVLFPRPRPGNPEGAQPIAAGVQTRIPRSGAVVLDEQTGQECLWVVASTQPLTALSPAALVHLAAAQPVPAAVTPPALDRPPPLPVRTDERGEPTAGRVAALRLRGAAIGRTVARFAFQHDRGSLVPTTSR